MGYTFHTVLCGHKPSYHHIPASAWFFKLQALMAPLPKSTERHATGQSQLVAPPSRCRKHIKRAWHCPQAPRRLPVLNRWCRPDRQGFQSAESQHQQSNVAAQQKKTCYQSFSKRIRRSGLDLSALSGSMIIYIIWFSSSDLQLRQQTASRSPIVKNEQRWVERQK